jgi:NAD(P)H dehydrogenase (quinone)
MRTLIVTAHPDTGSLTHQTARRLQELLCADLAGIAHLGQEGFDPRFTPNDHQLALGQGESDPTILAEQKRVDTATHLVLVFPVYWWTMPALLKGWIDRVFVEGWAFDYDNDGKLVPKLGRLTMHLLPIAGTSSESFARHGYAESFSTQVERGIIEFCGIRRGTTTFIYDSGSGDTEKLIADMEAAAATVASAITGATRALPTVRPYAVRLSP